MASIRFRGSKRWRSCESPHPPPRVHVLCETLNVWDFNWATQYAKKVVSDSLGLEDFAIGLVIFVLNLPNGQVKFLGEIQITEGL